MFMGILIRQEEKEWSFALRETWMTKTNEVSEFREILDFITRCKLEMVVKVLGARTSFEFNDSESSFKSLRELEDNLRIALFLKEKYGNVRKGLVRGGLVEEDI